MMALVFKYWLVLAPLAVVTAYGTALLFFRLVDLSFTQFATLLCAPLLQAVVLAWRAAAPANALAGLAWSAARHPLAQPVLLLDGMVLGAGVIGWDWHVVGFGAAVNIQTSWTLVKAAAAFSFLAGAVFRTRGGERATTALTFSAPLLLVLAIEPSTSWLAAGFARAHAAFGPQAEVLQRLAVYAPSFAILVGLVLRSGPAVARRSREAGLLVEFTIAAAVVVAVTVVLASFNLPNVTQPWLGVATLAASWGASCVLLAAIFLATRSRSTATIPPAQPGER
jgi:hypothetical protein